MVREDNTPPRKCDVGGCCEPGLYAFKKDMVCPYHFSAYIDDAMDLDTYFSLLESKVLGTAWKGDHDDDDDAYDLDDLSACLDFLKDSESEEAGEGESDA